MTAERLLVLHAGDLGTDELRQLVEVVVRESGHEMAGVRVTTYPTPAPSELLAHALVLRHADELGPDPLTRVSTYTIEAVGGRRVVVAVWAREVNPWVWRSAPKLLAKTDVPRPGWARLSTAPALAFLASARDGDTRQYPDVDVVVSVLPETRPRPARRRMPGGYQRWADGVFERAGIRRDGDTAHWLLCGRGLHVAYFSPDLTPVMPRRLMSRAEKRA